MLAETEVKYCKCGCGQITSRAKRNYRSYKEHILKGEYRRFIRGHHNRVLKQGYKRGYFKHHGYIYILKPDHPNRTQGNYVKRSRIIMEIALGRFLKSYEYVHHLNRVRDDDRIDNLKLVTLGQHNQEHNLAQKMLKARWPCSQKF